ncbi:EAL domain-containing protein [Pseudomonas sp. QL9]|uniref:Diguanylate phosphodiesterase n=1 Tax=Pseudomonas knackmussii (strain DSM 6978 / CCUG 54928 / LMG 23759 / B13) TaxID=1301098 RepID=A0A024HFT6_PSEKB|nr:EAL domain-containing protein [Pseudomonas knackmussii]CDF83746.1 diguanylate phosphodiesterase [Pseudomonas knackmussii B13]
MIPTDPVLVTDRPIGCRNCRDGRKLSFEFSMAFQPIVDARTKRVFAYESLVRGTDGSGAAGILGMVSEDNRYAFDQACRVKAVELAARLAVPCYLSINFLPNAVYQAATCIRATLEAAKRFDFPTRRIIFEITENEQLVEKQHLKDILLEYKRQGFQTAIDDFGAGYSGLGLLAEFQPDIIKLDMHLIRNIHQDKARTAITEGILDICKALGIQVVAEGVETAGEFAKLRSLGVDLFQGYLFARPRFEALPAVAWPDDANVLEREA